MIASLRIITTASPRAGLLRSLAAAGLLSALAFGAALLSGCDTRNVGTKLQPDTGPKITSFTVTPSDPAGLFGGEQATFKVEWEGGTAPYSADIDFGGAAQPGLHAGDASSPLAVTRSIGVNTAGGSFEVTASVADARGLSDTQFIHVSVAFGGNRPVPSIDGFIIDGPDLAVQVSDTVDTERITVSMDSATGGLITEHQLAFVMGGGLAIFHFEADDVFAGAQGTATFTAADSINIDTDTSGLITVQPLALADNTLAAIPLARHATTADTVKVVVATGPLAHAFQFMSSVSVVFPPDCSYDSESFDFGAPAIGDSALNPSASKDQETVDGIWTAVNPTSGFLGVDDNLLVPDTGLPAPFTGNSTIDFNVTPLGGSDAPAGTAGKLFNFNLKFTAPGRYRLDFSLFDEVNRTYYQDGSQAVFAWTDLSNNNGYSTVEVTP